MDFFSSPKKLINKLIESDAILNDRVCLEPKISVARQRDVIPSGLFEVDLYTVSTYTRENTVTFR
mgnify:CR=1 FL=1